MEVVLALILLLCPLIALIVGILLAKTKKKMSAAREQLAQLQFQLEAAQKDVETLSCYRGVADIAQEMERLKANAETACDLVKREADVMQTEARQALEAAGAEANQVLETARAESGALLSAADSNAKDILNQANEKAVSQVSLAEKQAKETLDAAQAKAQEIAGDAYTAMNKAKEYTAVVRALENVIAGYGYEYLKPTYSLLDELAEDFAYTDAGRCLKEAREKSTKLIREGGAATCEYVEDGRKTTAMAFVIDAFNGKVDSILSKTKKDNYGTLEQKIKDAYAVVNLNGKAFRSAAVTPQFLDARLQELRWGTITAELKAKKQEEERKIREQIREEERARKEYERAIKDAEKEQAEIQKAIAKAMERMGIATEEQKAQYELKLSELRQKLSESEARGQRALSMAQQTRHGNVYVISNIGSFGENVYKVGMTRRLEPMDRVKELGDASVPFPFDVHAIIESEDAPTLENELHKALSLLQVNKVNPRKEFFKVSLADIRALVDKKELNTVWTMESVAAEYRETLVIEEAMKTDPESKRRWEKFADSIAEDEIEELA